MAYGLDPNMILSLGLRPPSPYQTTQLMDPNVYQGYGGGSMPLFYDMQNAPQPFPTQPLGQPGYDPFAGGPIQPPPTAYPQTPPGFGMGPPPPPPPPGQPIDITNQQTPEEQQPGMDQVPMPNFPQYDPLGMGLTQFGLALMRASGPSPYKQGLLSRIGTAGPEGLSAFTGMSQLNFQNAQKAKELQVLEEGRRAQAMQRQAFTENLKEQLQSKKRTRQLLTALGEAKTPEERRTILAELYPDEAYKAELKRLGERTVVGEGAKLIGPNGEEIATGNQKTETPHTVEVGLPGNLELTQTMMFNQQTGKYDIPVGGPKKKGALVENKIDIGNQKVIGKNVFDKLDASQDQARTAVQNKQNVDRLREVLNTNKAITGMGAQAKLTAAQVINMLAGGNEQTLANTRKLIQGLSELTLQSRALMKGQGQISDREQQLLSQARGGDFSMTLPELKSLLDVFDRMAKATYDQHQQNYDKAKRLPGASEGGIDFYEPPESPWSQPAAPVQPKKSGMPWER